MADVTITEDDLAAHEDGAQQPDIIIENRVQEVELPQEVNVHYQDIDRDYEVGSQTARRLVTSSVSKLDIQLPIAMSADKAAQIAENILMEAWFERSLYRFSTSMKFVKVLPGDVLLVDGKNMRAKRISLAAPGLLSIEGVRKRVIAFTQTSEGENPTFTSQIIKIPGATESFFLDLPCLRDADDQPGFYLAVYGVRSNWNGAVVYKSTDGGVSYNPIKTALTEAIVGVATDALADGITTVIDKTSSVNISLRTIDSSLSSITEAQLLAGGNCAAIGTDGAWEIIHFQTATLEADGTYTLTDLLRGRDGTQWATSGHAIGDEFILLNESTIHRIVLDSDDIDTALLYKVATLGTNLFYVAEKEFTYTGECLEPLSPVHARGFRDGSGNLTISWIHRGRVGQAWRNYVETPVGEDSESYEIDIYDNGNVLRTITASSETASYTAAQQTTDFGSPQSSIHMKIYQLSATTGRGHELDVTL